VSLEQFNTMDEEKAREALALCCVSERWIDGMLEERPYDSADALHTRADALWADLGEGDYLQAFEGHPKIGDVASLRAKYAASGALAAGEQSGVSGADTALLERLARGNAEYEARFGFIFIVCASGKSAREMCDLLEARLHNPRQEELLIAAEEQRRILQLRLEKML
jgi:2-oxo-4-hydroxy-4-carboxy-5-ureidoimidazoline decarboxylase